MTFTREQIEHAVKSKGYVWFEGGKDYDLNIIGIRNNNSGDDVTNIFDDVMTVSYKVQGVWYFHQWKLTTDPGTKSVKHYTNPAGVARLVPGQYRRCYAIGLHAGKYTALRQVAPVKVFRDTNKDMVFDERVIDEGLFGINIHRSSPTGTSIYVENWSMGCQVFANINDFEKFMKLCRKSAEIFGNKFTYTLLESSDIQ